MKKCPLNGFKWKPKRGLHAGRVCTFRREEHSFGLCLQEEAAQDLEEALQEARLALSLRFAQSKI